ncbi:hypothetical protein A2801_00025 [Candidatus Woesebacteria bacterium RIFCSPHIGHO2_01_FULL_41_10]|uniref:DNA mismatch repair protein MutL n=1 Tax=Candidatus Woesebacteria bacterium RIFCSPHIGHO2_01_FULL_41_10 TaxID=1802500 RepID=A0A1F7YSX2_9BACT|nr:MAG: hypothetical protein A2801_00025 [Candidatus Woesebacteria bacterium RIFCSPHIGHO2_01_FULL_41_10]
MRNRRIRKLPKSVISHIAAGQVVERPSSVVKELVENALDAASTKIEIELENGGIDTIIVSDNGSGIESQDLEIAWDSYTTSKIFSLEDFSRLTTHGFRGEALSSIANAARLKIVSRTEKARYGTELLVENGQQKYLRPAGSKRGTTVTVDKLFSSLPARKKFLRSPKIELGHILHVISGYALCYPNISFRVFHNSTLLLSTPLNQIQKARLTSVLGASLKSNLLVVKHQSKYIKINGFIGVPRTATTGTHYQYLFVNNRLVADLSIIKSLKKAYNTLIEPKRTPILILFLELPSDCVDANVHPRKEKVRFSNPVEVVKAVEDAVTKTLAKAGYISVKDRPSHREMNTELGTKLKLAVQTWKPSSISMKSTDVLQVKNVFLIIESSQGIAIYDQHAVHERILYEQIFNTYEESAKLKKISRLTNLLKVEIPITDRPHLEDAVKILSRLGFALKTSERTVKISAIPDMYSGRDVAQIILDLFEDLHAESEATLFDDITHRTLSYLACRSAVKAGDSLTKKQCKDLLHQLSGTKIAHSCPHGRPLLYEISHKELERMFHR